MNRSRAFLLKVIQGLREEVATLLTRDLSGTEEAMCSSRIKHLFDYTMSDGKCARSCLAFDTFRTLCPDSTEDDLLKVGKVSATLELLQTFFLIIDDVMDHSALRRGKPCWHTLPGVGLTATNDGLLLDNAIDLIVRQTIPDHPKLHTIIRNIYEAKRKTVIGQMMDCDTQKLEDFTRTRYQAIVEHKTSHYTYFLPLSLGFDLADRMHGLFELRTLAYKIGHLFQVQDDYLDCFGDCSVTGKSSNDLSEGKCTWITCSLVEKLARQADGAERLAQFRTHFGRPGDEHLNAARKIVRDAAIDRDFFDFQTRTVAELQTEINESSTILPEVRGVLRDAVDGIVNRSK